MKTKVAEIMSKMTQNLPEMAFLFFSIRLTVLGASIGEALVLMSITGYIGYKRFLADKTKIYSDEHSQKLQELEQTMQALKVDKIFPRSPVNEQKDQVARRRF